MSRSETTTIQTAATAGLSAGDSAAPGFGRLFAAHLRATLRELGRSTSFAMSTIAMPSLLYLFFGATNASNPAEAGRLAAAWGLFGVLGVAFFQFGVGVAQSREKPWFAYLRTLPAGGGPRIAAQVVTALAFSMAAVAPVIVLAIAINGATLTLTAAVKLLVVLILGGIPFALLGLAIGLSVSARASVPIAHLVYFPLAFLGGLWLPPSMLPDIVNQISLLTPTRHYAELAWNAIADGPLPLIHWAWLLGWGVVFGWVALMAWRRDRGRRFV
ncbi:ABC transporter [Tistrella bauzanensis]|uniref:ABC transporter n=1 Tax=Tistrella bauzanensis TaxID=657419 RepID=A0ABQ1J1U1_9PROT|nr:ABC transporter permease [Tistrella bauzanensis]GGB57544.1 ABC transporter [Tistrella bauzanensis]